MQRDKDHNATIEEVAANREKALKVAAKYSPDLNLLTRIEITPELHVFVNPKKLEFLGREYFINKYSKYQKRRVKIGWCK